MFIDIFKSICDIGCFKNYFVILSTTMLFGCDSNNAVMLTTLARRHSLLTALQLASRQNSSPTKHHLEHSARDDASFS